MNLPPSDALVMRRSDVDSYVLCPKRIELRDFDSRQSSKALIIGQGVHGTIEELLKSQVPIRVSHAMVRKHLELVLHEEYGTTLLAAAGSKQAASEVEAEVYAAVREWRKHVSPLLPPSIAVEEKMFGKVDTLPSGRELWITGIPDYVTADELIDWKTAYKMWSAPKMETTVQPQVYAWLLARTQGIMVSTFRYWIWSRSKGEWATMTRPITQPSILAAMQLTADVGAAIDAEIFPARPFAGTIGRARGWWCSPRYCDSWDVCPAKYLITDEVVNDPAITGW